MRTVGGTGRRANPVVGHLVELDALPGAAVVLEEVNRDGGALVLDGARARQVRIHETVQLVGAKGRVELEGGSKGGLEDVEALDRGAMRRSRHFFRMVGSSGLEDGNCDDELRVLRAEDV